VLGLALAAQIFGAALFSIAARPFVVSLLSRAPWLSVPRPAAWLADLTARVQAALATLLQPPAIVERLNAMAKAWLAALWALVEAVWPAGMGLPLPSIDAALALVAAGAAVWLAGNTLLLRQPIAHLLRRRR
jgi:hypothetical protein